MIAPDNIKSNVDSHIRVSSFVLQPERIWNTHLMKWKIRPFRFILFNLNNSEWSNSTRLIAIIIYFTVQTYYNTSLSSLFLLSEIYWISFRNHEQRWNVAIYFKCLDNFLFCVHPGILEYLMYRTESFKNRFYE